MSIDFATLPSVFVFGIALTVAGCAKQGEWERVELQGEVTYAGQPVQKGQIRFIPADGSRGPITIDPIEGGTYSTQNTGGVPIGTLRVEIAGYDPEEYATAPTGPGSRPVRQLLPEKYNSQSELKITVDSNTPEELNFHLEP